jgi:hypothetical protein
MARVLCLALINSFPSVEGCDCFMKVLLTHGPAFLTLDEVANMQSAKRDAAGSAVRQEAIESRTDGTMAANFIGVLHNFSRARND